MALQPLFIRGWKQLSAYSSIDRVHSDLIRNAHSFLWSESAMERKKTYINVK